MTLLIVSEGYFHRVISIVHQIHCLVICLFIYFQMLPPGLGQVQLKLGDFRSALSNFEKVLEVYPDNCETLKVSA